ncbi:rhomboid family intramembrane serine protease [Desulfohalobiaceae bacterium Ax17]|uniref:rhomboid family intramembrane serine protease n=1 Tax=Desulfovulcanus ferrireducens TaxID=2831190 RepID=UPI00207BB402|nr:rhomboid family intramembrane serine protease [Desulfovulcanus ferrireducens]MBT8764422.1 rhomboid family intramembrane serine protease [Desulfovulcanus ferrireducens]
MIPLKDSIPHRETPFVNYAIMAVNILVFFIQVSLPEPYLITFIHKYGLVPARYTNEVWAFFAGLPPWDYSPFLTNMFLHGGWFHLISNMWALWIFGDNVEDRLGHFRYLIFYILCGLAANMTHFLTDLYSTIPVVGASGAIAGVMGAYLILFPYSRIITLIPVFFIPYFIEIPAVLYLVGWFVSQLFPGILAIVSANNGSSIAWWAHIGGFIAGIILLPLLRKKEYRRLYPDEIFINYRNL